MLSNYENNTNTILWLKELQNAIKMLSFCIQNHVIKLKKCLVFKESLTLKNRTYVILYYMRKNLLLRIKNTDETHHYTCELYLFQRNFLFVFDVGALKVEMTVKTSTRLLWTKVRMAGWASVCGEALNTAWESLSAKWRMRALQVHRGGYWWGHRTGIWDLIQQGMQV